MLGIISDTHGLLRPEATQALEGVEKILHLGDVGKPAVLDHLKQIAPVVVVRGNVDRGAWGATLPLVETVEWHEKHLYLLHILEDLDLDPAAGGFDMVLFGHSHKPTSYHQEGVWYLNPGSAGPRRFSLPITMARLHWEGEIKCEWIELLH
ncbi:MAG: metallophosphoesterase family protein [Bacteroidota bacterium]